ncbi:MAG: DUF177 domain-containing protein [Clostridia bacterium]|nr:DUF177 domain-containing protein [Clostridia bacterium]
MKVDISHISKVDGASLELEISENLEGLESSVEGFEFEDPVDFKGTLVNIGGILKLDGHLDVAYTSKCSRCLKDLKSEMSVTIRESFVNGEKLADEDSYTYEGNYVSIDKALKDNIVLNLPVRQLCTEECKGLCKICGGDLNAKDCDCKEETMNPQMEVLKNFFS